MGVSMGAIVIKTDTSSLNLLRVAKDVFGADFDISANSCDTRKSDCAFIAKTNDFLILSNSDIASKFFVSQTTEKIQPLLNYFSNPNFVFAFEEYDSGGTYSYSIIRDGIVKRQFRSITYEVVTDCGELEPVELKWERAEIIKHDVGDGEFEILYKDPEKDFSCSKLQLPQVILRELMLEHLGFISWNMDKFITEQGYFTKMSGTTRDENAAVNATSTTPAANIGFAIWWGKNGY